MSRTSPVARISWVTASVESVAAPRRSSALSASDLPAPIPPVSPTNGVRLGVAVCLLGIGPGGFALALGLSLTGLRLDGLSRLRRLSGAGLVRLDLGCNLANLVGLLG